MSSPHAPADAAASRWIRALAAGLHWAHTQAEVPSTRPEWVRLGLALSLLGLPRDLLRRGREADAFEEISGRILVLHGPARHRELHWWAALQAARESVDASDSRRSALGLRLHGLASDIGMARTVGPGLEAFGAADGTDAADGLERAGDRAARWLGLDEGLRHGPVPGLELAYPAAYRVATTLGELRAASLLQTEGASHRLERELEPALELLRLREHLPALEGLDTVGPDLWDAIDAWLEIGLGGLCDTVYRVAHDRAVLAQLPFRGLTFRRALGGLQQATARLRADGLRRDLDALARRIEDDDEVDADPPRALAQRIGTWLQTELPTEGQDAVSHGRILAWAHRFQTYHQPAVAPRIERFLAQFPGELRWVGEGLLDAVVYRSRAQVARSLAFVLDAYGLARKRGATLVSAGAGDFWPDLREAGLRLPQRSLSDALRDPGFETLILCDDALITGARCQEALAPELDTLTPDQRTALAGRDLVLVFVEGSLVGVDHLGHWLEEEGFTPRILLGSEERLLSDLGIEELDADTLYDEETGALTNPTAQLARPLFSVHEPVWGGRDPQVAKDLCADIGTALIGSLPDANEWPEERIRGAALGAGGLQGRWVFGHRVPPETLTCLWCAGTWRGRPWVPLFPEELPD